MADLGRASQIARSSAFPNCRALRPSGLAALTVSDLPSESRRGNAEQSRDLAI
jgi:hypothetical protein